MKDSSKTKQELIEELSGLKQRIRDLEKAESNRKPVEEALRKRVKELNCLYSIIDFYEKTDLLEDLLQNIVNQLPQGWCYPEHACARIALKDQAFKTGNFQETGWKLSANIMVHGKTFGAVDVCYLDKMPDRDEGPFLKEERRLINAVAERLGRVIARKRMEAVLHESEERYRKVFENHVAIKLLLDPDTGRIIKANEAAVNYYGWSHQTLEQMKIQEINVLSPEDVSKELERARTKKQIHFEFKHRRADGSIRDVEVYSSNIKEEGKDILHSIIHDITNRKQAEEERSRLILELREALSQVKMLSGLIPICASCKKIRNDTGYWEQIESYIRDHSEAEFSHSFCPECAKRLYPEFYKEK
ncbi:MAG: PAS domain S-box protein [Smithellaceae bacterium]